MKKLTTLLFLIVAVNAFGQTWKIDADARIAQHRKGALKIVVDDGNGNPLPGATVTVQMQRHSFNFGSSINADILADAQNGIPLSSNDQKELNEILTHFNMITFNNDLKWRNESSTTASMVNDALDFAEANRLAVRGHTILWPHDNKNGAVNHDFQLPDGSYSNSDIVDRWNAAGQTDTPAFTSWIRQSVTERINRMASTYAGRLMHWDVLNEPDDADSTGSHIWLEQRWCGGTIDLVDPATSNYTPTATGKQQLADIRAEWFKLASQANSEASLYYNNYSLVTRGINERFNTLQNVLTSLNDPTRVNAPGILDGLGMQAHFSGDVDSADNIWDRLEAHAQLDRNMKIAITEYDCVTTTEPVETNEADQLEYVLTEVFSHPQAEAFVMWGVWDGHHWKNNAPMYDIDWNLKLSGQRFLDLVFGEWWTDEAGTSDINGEYALDAFHGEHLVTVTVNGKVYQKTVHIDPSETNQTIAVMSIVNAPVLDSAFVRGGASADVPQAWTDALLLENSTDEDVTRVAMIKIDTSGFSNTVDVAKLTVYNDDISAHSLYVYGVKDSASFQDWTGGGSGNVTWNSVSTNGLFTPKFDLHAQGDANLTLLGNQTLSGANTGDVQVVVSNQALTDFLNNDTDGLVSLIFCSDADVPSGIRPHTHANAPTLEVIANQAPVFSSDSLTGTDATEHAAYSGSISAYDLEGDPLTFSKVSGPTWLNVASDGTLSGTPSNSDLGANAFIVQVDAVGGRDTATLNITVDVVPVPILESAFVRGGAEADTAQTWLGELALKNSSNEDFTRIAMIKVDASSIAGTVTSATFTVYDTDTKVHSLYVYGVHDSASFQDWTGGVLGSATWNSVSTNGLFTPKYNLHTLGDPNLTLLGSQALAGANTGDVAVTISGQPLVDFLNNDTNALVTFVFCVDVSTTVNIRPHMHANAPTLEYTYLVPNMTYEHWLSDYQSWLGSETNKTDNKDGDSANNLVEYALGGNPTNSTDTGIAPTLEIGMEGGSNYVEYIHVQRNDTDSLEYRVETTTDLVSGTWTNINVQITGTNTAYGVEGFDAVTNRIPAEPIQQFIRLEIQ